MLLRTLAVSGFAAAAWFVCAGVAGADEDHSDEVAKSLDSVNVADPVTVALGEQTAAADLLAEAVPADVAPYASVGVAPQPYESPSVGGAELFAVDYATVASRPLAVTSDPAEPEADRYQEPYPTPGSSSSSSDTGGLSYSGGYSSGYSHSGTASNTMPAALYEAKVAEKAARAAVQVSAPAPQPVPVAVPARATVLFAPTSLPAPAVSQVTSDAEVLWEVPEPSAPAPTPKQAPAPSAPTASSGSADSGGGGHRGGVIASLTGQSNLKPLAAWSAERRDDGRSPGSVPGLPSTSPD
ncbi:hypothetical protein ADK67_44650 [Saccharothrix sp. NRRL B-16348]|uniref:hypothetical protein n=1 Tax=Saccharothrix sp. NRRL B-16348 TaxID=1415542 RepID=UPI0006AE382E|nr:hypothetical protein [Saccharothrix sp. NRRL B-16348]KOX13071.1 hypothetical protein ADK67_44650 [Saccharothrix sp. NRRL B-16348]